MVKVVLGGGLSGLSAAFYLSKLTSGENIKLLEASGRLGGWIRSEKVNKDVIFEQGPRTIRPGGAIGINTLNLIDELSLHSEVVPIRNDNVAAKNRLIYANKELHLLPNSLPGFFIRQKPFTKSIFNWLLHDLSAEAKIVHDESIYDFTKRRFGPEIADYLIDTLICGICAGNSREVSVNFLMKRMFDHEQKYGSVLKGILKHIFDKKEKLPKQGILAARSKLEKWSIYTFKNGIETLPATLEALLRSLENVDIKLKSKCKEITFRNSGEASIILEDGHQYDSSYIISSIAGKHLAPMLQKQHPTLANKLLKIKMVSVAVVNLLYEGNLIKQPAFGFLVPPKEKLPILGVIYDSCCKSYTDKTVLTVMMGGYWFNDLFGENPSEQLLLNVAMNNLKNIIGIDQTPTYSKVNILKDCIPQYVVGHQHNINEINSYIKSKKLPLAICGSSYYGVGVNDVIMSSRNAIENILS